MTVLAVKRFHLNGHTIGFHAQNQKIELHYMSPLLTLGGKGFQIVSESIVIALSKYLQCIHVIVFVIPISVVNTDIILMYSITFIPDCLNTELRDMKLQEEKLKEKCKQEDGIVSAVSLWTNEILPNWETM